MNFLLAQTTIETVKQSMRPDILFPVLTILIIITVVLLIILQRPVEEKTTPTNFEFENNIYEKMYGQLPNRKAEKPVEESSTFHNESVINPEEGEAYKTGLLLQKNGPDPGSQYFIEQDEILIGRGEENDLVLWDPSVNERHVKIKRINGRFIIFDNVSRSGVYLNERKLLRPRALNDFDEIRAGRVLFIFRGK